MTHRHLFPALAAALAAVLVTGAASAAPSGSETDAFSAALAQGPVYAALAAFFGGLLVSLTPCVYPMIAVTVSLFGARQSETRWHGTRLSSAFVAGIVCMFTPLGVVAGLTGSVFGSVLQNSWVLVGIAVLFLAMAASLFGAFDLALPSGLVNRLNQVGGMGVKGAFGLGMVCGLIAAPCTGPVLTGILTWIAQTQSAGLGALAMGAFSLGLGVPFFAVGAFAMQLPKSGQWMVAIKSVLGIVMAVVALYFLNTAFPKVLSWVRPDPSFLAAAAGLALVGLLLGAVHKDFHSPEWKDRLTKGVGVALTSLATFVLVLGFSTPERSLSWEEVPLAHARQTAVEEGRPLLVDFTASWCVACKEMDKLTFAEPQVAREAGRFLAVKIDATDDEDPAVQQAMHALGVVGLPTVVIFDSEGQEAVRYTDFVPAERFLEAIRAVN